MLDRVALEHRISQWTAHKAAEYRNWRPDIFNHGHDFVFSVDNFLVSHGFSGDRQDNCEFRLLCV